MIGKTHRIRGLGVVVGVVLLLTAVPARPQSPGVLLDLLQVGSHPHLGLGGDPFRDPIVGTGGWWNQPVFDEEYVVHLRLTELHPVSPRLSGGDLQLRRTSTELTLARRWHWQSTDLGLGLIVRRSGVQHAWSGNEAGVSLDSRGNQLAGLVRLNGLVPGFRLQAAIPLHSTEAPETLPLQVGIRTALAGHLWLAADWADRAVADEAGARVEDEAFFTSVAVRTRRFHAGARLAFGRMGLSSRFAETDARPERTPSPVRGHEFRMDGTVILRQHGLDWEHTGFGRFLLRYTKLDLHGTGNGYQSELRYARISHVRLEMTSWLAAARLPLGGESDLLLDLELVRFDAFGRAKIESWPFASWESAWLNGARVLLLAADGRWHRLHSGLQTRLGTVDLTAGLSYYDIYPEASVETWTAVLLTRSDTQRTHPLTSRYSLGAVSVSAGIPVGPIVLSGRVHQFVHADDHSPGSGGGEEPGSPSPGTGGWFGGTFAEFSIGYGRF